MCKCFSRMYVFAPHVYLVHMKVRRSYQDIRSPGTRVAATMEECSLLAHSQVLGNCLSYIYSPRQHSQGIVVPTVGWTILHQLTIKTIPCKYGNRPV